MKKMTTIRNREGAFGTYEAICITSTLMITKIFYTSISVIIDIEGTSGWIGTIVSCLTTLVMFSLIYMLMKRFPNKDITQIFEAVLGRFSGKVLSLVFSAYLLFYAASSLREFVEMIKAYNLPYSPPSLLIFAFIAVCAIVAYYGLEGIARISGIFFIPVIVALFVILLLASPNYNINYMKPYLGYGLKETVVTGLLRCSAYDEVLILAFMINSMHGLKTFKRAGYASIIITGITFSSNLLCNVLAFTYTGGRENLSGLFELSRAIYFNRFVQRLESIFLFAWVISSLVSVSIAFYLSINIYTKAFRIPGHRPLIFPFSFLLFMVALVPKNMSEVVQLNIHFIRQYSCFFIYLVPVLILFIAVIFRKRGDIVHGKKN
ncbi:endospore germination permease [Ruminiclostridium cellobioparum]|uniref:GerAB/ArcD/ProY family transporter n=1 Tax=Ruminiclostridium cellobioparum TaxID=29355 RepID=UPI0030EF2E28